MDAHEHFWMGSRCEECGADYYLTRIAELEAERDQLNKKALEQAAAVAKWLQEKYALTAERDELKAHSLWLTKQFHTNPMPILAERDRYKAAYEDFLCRMHEVAQCAKGSCALCPNCVTKLLGVKP